MKSREIGRKEAALLSERVKKVIKIIKIVDKHVSDSEKSVQKAVRPAINDEYIFALHSVPVEKLNEDRAGLRVSILRRAGYTDLFSVLQVGPQKISMLKGISSSMAYDICKRAENIANGIKSTIRVRLSTDHISSGYTDLVTSIAKNRHAQEENQVVQDVQRLLPENPQNELRKLDRLTNNLRWRFANSEKKSQAIDAYRLWESVIDEAEHMLAGIYRSKKVSVTNTQAWQEFATNPVDFNTTLERILSGKSNIEKSGYGISENIRESVNSVQLNLVGLKCQLRYYQVWGVKYILSQKRVLLGDEMGLGKTIQALAALISLRNSGETHFIVVCPASVIENWCREITEKSDLQAFNLHDFCWDSIMENWMKQGGVAVINYESIHTRIKIPLPVQIGMVVVDEAHYIKNPQAQRSINVLKVCSQSFRVLFMTGTPLENNVSEMVGLIRRLQPHIADMASRCSASYYAESFKDIISPVYYRRKRVDVLSELPELIETQEWCQMTSDDEVAYEHDILTGNFMQARRVSWSNPNYKTTSSKVRRMKEIVEQAEADGRKVIVFSFFLENLDRIREVFGSKCVGIVSGAVAIHERQRIIDAFTNAPVGAVLAAQIQSGGTGLNIQAASVVIICEPQYKPSTENQAISRAYRMGQIRDVTVHRLLCTGTVDERVTQILIRKQKDFDTYADESIAAKRDRSRMGTEEWEIDSKTKDKIFADEQARIMAKHGITDIKQYQQSCGPQ